MDVMNVDPLQTLSSISSSVENALSSFGSEFESITGSFGSGFNSAAELFQRISSSDAINLSLDASIDFEVLMNLSLESVQVSALVHELSASFTAAISNEFSTSFDPLNLHITPSIVLELEARNAAASPFDVIANPGQLGNFIFGGSFMGQVSVQVEGVPAEVTLAAVLPDITNASTIDFDLKLDISLTPIQDKVMDLLADISALSYPKWLKDTAPFLPELNLGCIEKAGVAFLTNNTSASVSGFLSAIAQGCSSKSLSLSGGYDSATEQFEMNIAVELGGSRNL